MQRLLTKSTADKKAVGEQNRYLGAGSEAAPAEFEKPNHDKQKEQSQVASNSEVTDKDKTNQQQEIEIDPINRPDTDEFLLGKVAYFASFRLGGDDLDYLANKGISEEEEKRVLRETLGGEHPEVAEIAGRVEGAITASDKNEIVYLILPEGHLAIDPQSGKDNFLRFLRMGT